ANTNSGEEWFCRVKTTDTLNAFSGYVVSQTVLISSYSWQISSFARKNESEIEKGEFLFEDKTGETSDSNFDIEEFRLAGNTDNIFIRIKMFDADSADNYQFALTFSTASGGQQTIGDDSGFFLGNLYGENFWQRQIIFHSTATGSFTAELNDGSGWTQSSSVVNFYENASVMESEIPRAEIGLVSTTTFQISLAVFQNSVGRASAKDTTSSGALDCLTVSSFTLNDGGWEVSGSLEDLSDGDIDFFARMTILSTGSVVNQKPADFSLETPSGTISQLNPYFDWTDSSDSDGEITSYIVEISTAQDMDGDILWRVNTSTSEFQLPENLTGESTYFWRAGARDDSGEITFSATWYFYISVTEPVCSAPQDDTNLNNYGEANGAEDADGNVTLYWPPASDSVAIQNYYIRISTDSSFNFVYSSATTSADQRNYTFGNLAKGLFWYAQVRAKNISGITGDWSESSDGIYVNRKTVDADLSDWSPPPLSKNTTGLFQSDAFWSDEKGDQRKDKSDSSQLDISTFAVTADRYNLYFYFVFASTVGTFSSGRQFIELAVDNDITSTERVIIGRNETSEDTYISGDTPWEYIVKITSTNGFGVVEAVDSNFNTVGYGKYSEDSANFFIEGMMPLEKIGGSSSFLGQNVNFAAAVLENDGAGGVSQWAAGNSNVVDVVSSTSAWSEVSNQVIDFYLTVSFDSNGEVVGIASHTVTNVPPPDEPNSDGYSYSWPRNLAVYYLNVDRFYNGDSTNEPSDVNMTGGDFEGIIQKVDYFNELGVNMIYTMPIDYFGGGVWGYNHSDIYKIQDSYGDYQKFIEMAKVLKRRNIKIAIDWVPGQVYQGRTYERHPEIFYGERFGA
ncbi:MAG: hypothetical protein J7L54_02750, partial [Elusimicrobia bacterium]|nr:hypothetical protein [Elusimicrobiota bacterium]